MAPRLPFTTFVLKLLAGIGGGVVGSLVILAISLVASSILTPFSEGFAETEYISPIFIFIIMMMVFLSSTGSNLLSTFLLAMTENEKYKRTSSAIYQIFIVSIIIFILMVPVYFITASINPAVIAYAMGLHILVTAQVSALILEIVSNYRYALVGVYGVTFSILVSAAVIFGIANFIANPAIILFLSLPIVWGSIAFTQSMVTGIYGWFARTYDKDFLATNTLYGNDYGKQVEDTDEEPKAKDEKGADFLRNN